MRILIAAALAAVFTAASADAATVLVTGSNRGIGYEFAKQYAEKGHTVIATARNPDGAKELKALAAKHKNITIEKLDIVSESDLKALTAKYKGKPIDILINNAAIVGDIAGQTLGTYTRRDFDEVMGVNLWGAIAVTQGFLDNVAASKEKKVVVLSSGIVIMRPGPAQAAFRDEKTGYFNLTWYRSAKIALNFTFKGIAEDLKSKGVLIGVIAPGAVNTEMARGVFDEAALKNFVPASTSAAGIIKVIDGLNAENSGKAFDWDGKALTPY